MRGNQAVQQEAERLKAKVVVPFSEVPNSRFLPIAHVYRLRSILNKYSIQTSPDVSNKTIASRIAPVLAARDVHLYSLSRKYRCYALGNALSETVQSVISMGSGDNVTLLAVEKRKMLATVTKHFFDKKDEYCKGKWSLSEEIVSIPSRLWASFIIDMASNKQFVSWKVSASPNGKTILDLFPVCNDPQKIPRDDLDDFARKSLIKRNKEYSLPRADFLLCLRTLKVIEQAAFSRSRLSVGPLKMTLSLAGIIESTASWTSVLHAMGLVTSYDSTEHFRKKLIAEREQAPQGAFDQMKFDQRAVTVQIDNFDMLPFHSVKACGKRLPMISGTATQSVIHSKKRRRISIHTTQSEPINDSGTGWLDPKKALTSRAAFIDSVTAQENKDILNDFHDVAFGMAFQHREVLLGSLPSSSKYKRGGSEKLYKHQGLNFRTLLLSCSKQHGG